MCETWVLAFRGREDGAEPEMQEELAYSLRTPGGGSSHQFVVPTLRVNNRNNSNPVTEASMLISSTAGSPARTSAWPADGPVLGASAAVSGLSSTGCCANCGHDGSSLRMSLDFYPPVVPPFSPPSFSSGEGWLPDGLEELLAGILTGSSSGDLTGLLPLLDELSRALTSEWSSPDLANSGIAWDGRYWTRSTSESRNAAAACSLSRVLQGEVLSKYFLSAKAAAGILRRAERRGKELPAPLLSALRTLGQTATE
jgi:hypothetical protein